MHSSSSVSEKLPSSVDRAIAGLSTFPRADIAARCPFYHLVPKDRLENLAYREHLIRKAEADPNFADLLVDACSQDILFFINAFCFTLDPRREDCPKIAWITWEEQDHVILAINDSLGRYGLWIPKSRDQSLTWNTLVNFAWDFLFHRDVHYMVASWKEKMVDNGDDPNTLFAKLDFLFEMLPEFLKPQLSRVSLLWSNKTLKSTISGEATTGDLGRAGRQKGILIDEAATIDSLGGVIQSIAAVTDNAIYISTHKGPNTTFNKELSKPGKSVMKVHWTSRPTHRQGLYTSRNGRPILLDTEFRGKVRIEQAEYYFPDNYPFILDGKLRSPYYDHMCSKLGNDPVRIASELDINPMGSIANYFPLDMVDRAKTQCRMPMHTGELDYDDRTAEPVARGFVEVATGRLRLWVPVDEQGNVPQARYVLACDIGAGTGSSTSTVCIANLETGDYVGSWACAYTSPEKFAFQVTALRRWLGTPDAPAYVIWEQNGGPGSIFAKKMLELEPSMVYHREAKNGRTGESTNIPGWWTDGDSKSAAFGNLREALEKGWFIIPDEFVVEELRQYRYGPGAVPLHDGSVTDDITAARDAHGDRVVAAALLWHVVRQSLNTQPEEDTAVPINSPAEHIRRALAQERAEEMGLLACEWEGGWAA